MNKTLLLALFLATGTLAGCLGGGSTAPSGEPSFPNPQPGSVTALQALAQLDGGDGEPYPSAGGIWTYGDFVFGSGLGSGFFVADISDPAAPELLWRSPEDALTPFSRDADVIEHPDGSLTLVLATQSDGMHIYDVSEPAQPEFLSRTAYEDASGEPIPNHNIAVVPGTQLVFNSRSGGAGSTNDLVDLSDPRRPVVLGTYGTHGCHDITFHGSLGSAPFRAYCAGIDRTEIWDLDAFDVGAADEDFGIELVSTIEGEASPVVGNPLFAAYPARTLHHLAMVNEDASVLIIGDEHNGGGSPGACYFHDPVTGTSTPLGALWFYDLSDETAPQLLSWLSPPPVVSSDPSVNPEATDPTNPLGILNNMPSCTAHFGTLVPGEEKLVMSWYNAGVLLIDFSDPAMPTILHQYLPEDVLTWDARVHNGYVFTGDISRGMDVLQLA